MYSLSEQLLTAAREGNLQTLQSLLSEGVDVNSTNSDGITALMIASELGHTEIVRTLVALPTLNVNAVALSNTNALYEAAFGGHTEIVQMLLAAGIQVNVQSAGGSTPLIEACCGGHLDIVRQLLEVPGINIHFKTCLGHDALKYARGRNYTEIVQVLLNHV
jgi:ankyrin repeat protein